MHSSPDTRDKVIKHAILPRLYRLEELRGDIEEYALERVRELTRREGHAVEEDFNRLSYLYLSLCQKVTTILASLPRPPPTWPRVGRMRT